MASSKLFYDLVRSAPKGRFNGIQRSYGPEEVQRLRGSVLIDYTLATRGANRLWSLLHSEPYVNALGALTGNQAVQMVRAGLNSIYLSGWQVAADNNLSGSMYPDQSLYPANSGPELAKRINKALTRADQIEKSENNGAAASRDWYAPIVADAEAGFGGALNCYEIMLAYLEAGAAGVHFEDQLASEKKCGHLGGKVLIPTLAHVRNLNAARLAADVAGVPSVIVCRTDACSATLITSDIDECDRFFIDSSAGRTAEGFYRLKAGSGLEHSIQRAKICAPYSDLIWMETSTPSFEECKKFAEGVKKEFPDKMLAYNCSPSFNWEANLNPSQIASFQKEIGAMGYKYQFVTLAGFHMLNYGMFTLAKDYKQSGMAAYSKLQQAEFAAQKDGYTAVKHQREVGTGYFDLVSMAAGGGKSSTTALEGSTETAQFVSKSKPIPAVHTAGYATSAKDGVKITKPIEGADKTILTEQAIDFLAMLHRKFEPRRQALLDARKETQVKLNSGKLPDFREDTADIRNDPKWTVGSIPADMQDRRVEITGPVDRKMVINALNSGARTYMADFEDSTAPTWRNQLDGQINLYDAIRRNIDFKEPKSGKTYALKDKHAVLMARPRGWHLPESHVLIDGQVMSGSLFDFGLYFFHNAKKLLENGSGPYFYLPKMQSYKEAELWNDVFLASQDHLGLGKGTIKATVLLEHILAAFESEEIIYALRDHMLGLNCGRWDYIFSYIKAFQKDPTRILPDRSLISMKVPFMKSYSAHTIKICHRRGAQAMGGMAAQIPIKNDPEANEKAMELVRQDKERESKDGHDGTWVAHPGLVQMATDIFDKNCPTPNQIHIQRADVNVTQKDLLALPKGTMTERGLRHNVDVGIKYLESWLRGTGCVPIYNLMEDAATAEISRAQVWQWLRHQVTLTNGSKVNEALVRKVIEDETKVWDSNGANRAEDAADLFSQMLFTPEMPEFLTLAAYEKLVSEGK